jgi:hypothetical protein
MLPEKSVFEMVMLLLTGSGFVTRLFAKNSITGLLPDDITLVKLLLSIVIVFLLVLDSWYMGNVMNAYI